MNNFFHFIAYLVSRLKDSLALTNPEGIAGYLFSRLEDGKVLNGEESMSYDDDKMFFEITIRTNWPPISPYAQLSPPFHQGIHPQPLPFGDNFFPERHCVGAHSLNSKTSHFSPNHPYFDLFSYKHLFVTCVIYLATQSKHLKIQ